MLNLIVGDTITTLPTLSNRPSAEHPYLVKLRDVPDVYCCRDLTAVRDDLREYLEFYGVAEAAVSDVRFYQRHCP